MRNAVLAMMERHRMVPAGTRVIVAVSGGPDSVCLLHVLRDIANVVGVAHFNHKLRGEESDGDERFVRELAASAGLPVYVASVDVRSAEGNLEQNARRARRRFFRELIASGSVDRIATGHTRDDQAETVLFRVLRGAGTTGLAGILPVTAEGLIRPLLDVRREEVRAYLRDRGLAWREDSSNLSSQFARNRIRRDLLPQLEREWNPRLTEVLAHLADVSYEEEVRWAKEVAVASGEWVVDAGSVEFPVASVTRHSLALQRRLMRHAIRLAKGNLARVEFDHIDGLVELASRAGSGRRSLPGLIATRSFEWMRLASPGVEVPPGTVRVLGPGRYGFGSGKSMTEMELSEMLRASDGYDTLGLEFRAWRPGDQYWPAGAGRTWSVKELFQKARVPSWRRAVWPILTSKGKILWVKQFGLAKEAGWLAIREIPATGMNLSSPK